MRRRVLVTGASGLLGTWLLRTAPADVEVVATTHSTPVHGVPTTQVDLRDAAAVRAAVRSVRPAVVLHAAYARDEASIVDATRHLVGAAGSVGAGFVHVSSDTVFAGDGRPRAEDDPTDPTSDYGRWKAAVEHPVLDTDGAVVRASLLVSTAPDDHGLRRLRAGAAEGAPTTWYRDEFRQPAWASEVAEALWRLLDLAPDARGGCWHLPGPERLSRLELATRLASRAGLAPSTIEPGVLPPGSDRPADIVLTDDRARRGLAWDPTPIR